LLGQLPVKHFIEDAKSETLPELSVFDLVRVYRDLATAYYAVGQPDEAICYSTRAVQVMGVPVQLLLHARMLLSLNKPRAAAATFRQLMGGVGDSWSGALIDYGVALHLLGDDPLAEQAVDRVIAKGSVSPSRQLMASVVKLLITQKELARIAKDEEAQEGADSFSENAGEARHALVQESVLENLPDFCESIYVELPSYWPEGVMSQVDELFEAVCNGRNEHVS
jgi:tetratricopeptide (TPR) repeat protein